MNYSSALVWGGHSADIDGLRLTRDDGEPCFGVSQQILATRMAADLGKVQLLLDDVLNTWGLESQLPADSVHHLREFANRVANLDDDMMLVENAELRQALNCYYRELATGVAMICYQAARMVRMQKLCAESAEEAVCRELDARLRECVRQLRWLKSQARSLIERCRGSVG